MKLPLDIPKYGQILPGSPFGDALTALARRSEVIVEIGTFRGLGSTRCLAMGLERASQRFYMVDLFADNIADAKAFYDDPRIVFIVGTLVRPDEVLPCLYPGTLDYRPYYDAEVAANRKAPYVLDQMPPKIDLLMIDGGEWSAGIEFARLWQRSKIIAMDDTNGRTNQKNVKNRLLLLHRRGWRALFDRMNERSGWAIFERTS